MTTPDWTVPLHDAGLAADPATGTVLAFGGTESTTDGGSAPSTATRAWDGDLWRPVKSPVVPPGRQHPLLVSDAAAGRVLMLSGVSHHTQPVPPARSATRPTSAPSRLRRSDWLADAWTWSAGTWSPLLDVRSQVSGQISYHHDLGAPVLVGSVRNIVTGPAAVRVIAGTWRWDGTQWIAISSAVPRYALTALGYDPHGGRLVGLVARNPINVNLPFSGTRRPLPAARPGTAEAWIFDGHAWHRDSALDPLDQASGVLANDPAGGHLVLITALGHTWALQDGEWQAVIGSTSLPATVADPNARLHAAAIPVGIVLVTTSTEAADQTWTFNGHEWRYHARRPSP
ncbi:MAG TPA: hypothetical protein VG317_16365 [Pseudonocardiaceae bacterium]|jgi:hypothetical protein|nr:hypothetical protein [Pseudonocardiaceae bacterium]